MEEIQLAPHELFDVHELLAFKNLCAVKSAALSGMVSDDELKDLIQNDVSLARQQIHELKALLSSGAMPDWTSVRPAGVMPSAGPGMESTTM
jgi:similar to spore coat protein